MEDRIGYRLGWAARYTGLGRMSLFYDTRMTKESRLVVDILSQEWI